MKVGLISQQLLIKYTSVIVYGHIIVCEGESSDLVESIVF